MFSRQGRLFCDFVQLSNAKKLQVLGRQYKPYMS